jgi:hypothetical protein
MLIDQRALIDKGIKLIYNNLQGGNMAFKCKIGLHSWNGCKCSECGKIRDEQHDWSKDCKCNLCGQVQHRWDKESEPCMRCGKVIEIATLLELQSINDDLKGHYKLIADIDASETKNWNFGKGFIPITLFWGILNGNNHTIKNLYIHRPEENSSGLFAMLYGEVINLELTDININCKVASGGISAHSKGKISRCKVSGSITGEGAAGGLVGWSTKSTIISSQSSAKVVGQQNVGGLVGRNDDSKISLCKAYCVVTGKLDIGGLIGLNIGSYVSECIAECDISGEMNVGGLVGRNNVAFIHSCLSNSHVEGKKNIGGLIGFNGGSETKNNEKSEISCCCASGFVTGGEVVGGFIGCYMGFDPSQKLLDSVSTIKKCLSSCNVVGGKSVGSFVGMNFENSNIYECLATGSATCANIQKGFAAINSGIIKESYWVCSAKELTTISDSSIANGIGILFSEIKKRETFISWDFQNTWHIEENGSYPTLQCLTTLNLKKETINNDKLPSEVIHNNTKWGFSISYPTTWSIIRDEHSENTWIHPIVLGKVENGKTIAVCILSIGKLAEIGTTDQYISQAESQLANSFKDFSLISGTEKTINNLKTAWMHYTYSENEKKLSEYNITFFFGKNKTLSFLPIGVQVPFQIICFTDYALFHDFQSEFLAIIHSLSFPNNRFWLSQVSLFGNSNLICDSCKNSVNGNNSSLLINLLENDFRVICNDCHKYEKP